MEEYNKDAWAEIVERCQDAGADSLQLHVSCPHGLPERKMGAAVGENPEIVEEVVGWVMKAAKKPVWAKMTPNVTRITEPSRAAFRGGCEGVSAINTIRSVMSVNLETLRPEPSVEGFTTPGGYSCKAVRPIALRMVMEIATMIRREFPGKSLSAIGGIETGDDAAQFILLGGDTTQVTRHLFAHLSTASGAKFPASKKRRFTIRRAVKSSLRFLRARKNMSILRSNRRRRPFRNGATPRRSNARVCSFVIGNCSKK